MKVLAYHGGTPTSESVKRKCSPIPRTKWNQNFDGDALNTVGGWFTEDIGVAESYADPRGKEPVWEAWLEADENEILAFDCKGAPWNEIHIQGKTYDLDELASYAAGEGFKAARFENVKDIGPYSAGGIPATANSYCVFDPGVISGIKKMDNALYENIYMESLFQNILSLSSTAT